VFLTAPSSTIEQLQPHTLDIETFGCKLIDPLDKNDDETESSHYKIFIVELYKSFLDVRAEPVEREPCQRMGK
jgi:hypothetical protein